MAFCFELGEKAIFPFTDGKAIKFMVRSQTLNYITFKHELKELLSSFWNIVRHGVK